MAIKWTNEQEVKKQFRDLERRYNLKACQWLSRLGELVVKYAREHGNYTDRTANLRNSIGYLVVCNGNIFTASFSGNNPSRGGEKGNASDARSVGLNYAKQVASELDSNKIYLVWVAGMEYAAYVEAKGFDVINGSGEWLESNARKQTAMFKRFLMSKE